MSETGSRDMRSFLLKMKMKTLLYSLQAGRFIVKKFSQSGVGCREWEWRSVFTRWFKLRTLFETVGFSGVSI